VSPITAEVILIDTFLHPCSYKQALHSAKLAKELAAKSNPPLAFTRPDDYYAEMIKSDAHMSRIRQRLLDETAGIKKGEEKRKEREMKKIGKQVQLEKLKERRERGRDEVEKVKGLKRSKCHFIRCAT
jgi:rRNA-processing protein EBP2